jgi:hypothetical protein
MIARHQTPGTAVTLQAPPAAAGIGAALRDRGDGSHDERSGNHAREIPADNKRWNWSFRRPPIPRIPRCRLLTVIALIATLCAGCSSQPETVASFKPEFLPVALSVNPSGISIEGTQSIVTPIGTFSIGALYELPPRNPSSIYVTLRDRRTRFDQVFEVRTGADQFMAVVNGTTGISIANGQVLIDITDGSIKQVSFERVSDQIRQQSDSNWLEKAWHVTIIRWIIIIMILWLILRRIIRGY